MDKQNERFILRIAENAVSIDGSALADTLETEMIPDSVKEATKKSIQAEADVLRVMGTDIHPLDWTVEKLATSPLLLPIA